MPRFRATVSARGGELDIGDLRMLLPRGSRMFDGLHIYYFHELPLNSAYMGDDVVIAN